MITIKDVAKEAGVAIGTVSRVINNKSVKECNKQKVQEAIDRLGYQVDTYARGLKLNRTHTIAVILPSVWNSFFGEFTYYVELELSKRGYKAMLCNSDGDRKKEIQYIQMAQQNKVDGIIAITYSDIDEYTMANLPLVSIDRYFKEDIAYITSDNVAGGKLAAEKLIEGGCTKLAFVGSGSNIENETMNRKKSFDVECSARGVENIIFEMVEPIDNLKECLNEFIVQEIVTAEKPIDGVFAVTDGLALILIELLKAFNISVPEDIQIIGYDGIRMEKEMSYMVSSIRQPLDLMAKKAVEVLLDIIEGKAVVKRNVLPISYVEGGSTKTIKL